MLTFNHGLQLGSCVEFTGKNAELEQLIVLCVLLYVELHELKTVSHLGLFNRWDISLPEGHKGKYSS